MFNGLSGGLEPAKQPRGLTLPTLVRQAFIPRAHRGIPSAAPLIGRRGGGHVRPSGSGRFDIRSISIATRPRRGTRAQRHGRSSGSRPPVCISLVRNGLFSATLTRTIPKAASRAKAPRDPRAVHPRSEGLGVQTKAVLLFPSCADLCPAGGCSKTLLLCPSDGPRHGPSGKNEPDQGKPHHKHHANGHAHKFQQTPGKPSAHIPAPRHKRLRFKNQIRVCLRPRGEHGHDHQEGQKQHGKPDSHAEGGLAALGHEQQAHGDGKQHHGKHIGPKAETLMQPGGQGA